eukprot:1065396-Pelagomonas_calceolata.AAC.5
MNLTAIDSQHQMKQGLWKRIGASEGLAVFRTLTGTADQSLAPSQLSHSSLPKRCAQLLLTSTRLAGEELPGKWGTPKRTAVGLDRLWQHLAPAASALPAVLAPPHAC